MYTCGFIQSIRVTTPLWVTGFWLSYSAANEWWAQAGAAASSNPPIARTPPKNTDFIKLDLPISPPISTGSVYNPARAAARRAKQQVFCYNRIMQDRQVI